MRTCHLLSKLSNKVGFPRIQRPAYILSRSLWSSYTASHPTCFTPSTLSIRSPDICIAIVSNTFSHAELESIPKHLTTLLNPKLLIGCVVDKIHGNLPDGNGVSLLVGDLSLNKSVSISEFSYEIEGDRRLFKTSNVGRWFSNNESRNRDDIGKLFDMGKFELPSAAPSEKDLPSGLKKLKESGSGEGLLFMFSDMEPHLLLRSLDHHFPAYKKLGIIGTSTPFTTARPVTLFYNEHVLSQGVVGFSLTPTSIGDIALQHSSLSPFGDIMKITKCRGNIILELDGLNATRLLLDSLRAGNADVSKETELYLGIYPPSVDRYDDSTLIISKITSGDPAKGSMAIDTIDDLQVNQCVKFMYRSTGEPTKIMKDHTQNSKESSINLILSVSDPEDCQNSTIKNPDEPKVSKSNTFGGISENGIIIGHGGVEGSWVCNIPNSMITTRLNK
ncbi:7587_t:CDS:2 [Paraglomus brasilianum]|uniref:7587_t:CDS:1 n=1 Tax=Paraglomus brasilianum TaxID=144538 RepID=A0A9N8ZXH1_9GLOM|nr:7587_t:CDS:2 [Paraglomus brasilianum]